MDLKSFYINIPKFFSPAAASLKKPHRQSKAWFFQLCNKHGIEDSKYLSPPLPCCPQCSPVFQSDFITCCLFPGHLSHCALSVCSSRNALLFTLTSLSKGILSILNRHFKCRFFLKFLRTPQLNVITLERGSLFSNAITLPAFWLGSVLFFLCLAF